LLKQYIAVAEELHYGRAAERVGIAQSPLSQAIQKLEAHVGTPLLVRNKRSVSLTEAGRVFLEEAYQWLKYEQVAIERTQHARDGRIGRLSIGFIGSAGYGFMPELVSEFRRQYPHVRLRLIEMTTKDQMEQLQRRYLDAGMLRTPLPRESQQILTQFHKHDQLMAALPRHHRLARKNRIDLSELAGDTFAAFSKEKIPAAHAQLITACAAAGFSPDIEQECTQIASIVCLVAAGLAVALIPGNLASLMHPKVQYVPLSNEGGFLTQQISIAWRTGDDNPALTSWLKVAAALSDPLKP